LARLRPEAFLSVSFGTTKQAAEKLAKQIPRRPEGLLEMTKIDDLRRRT